MKKVCCLIVTLFLLLNIQANGQVTFQRTYGGTNDETSSAMIRDNDGGYVMLGTTKSFGVDSTDIYLVKTDVFGDTLWTRTYGGANDDYASTIQKTIDNGYIIGGNTKSFGATFGEGYLIKTDSDGIIQWTKTYSGGDYASFSSVLQTSDSGFIAGGSYKWAGPGGATLHLLKTDSNGNVAWSKTYSPGGITGNCYINSIQKTIDGSYIVTGTVDVGGDIKIILMKTDAAGNPLWTKTIFFSDGLFAYSSSILNTSDSGFVISGYYLVVAAGTTSSFLMKSDSVGNILWSNRFYFSASARIFSLQKSFDGYILGGSKSGSGYPLLIIKTNLNGAPVWAKTYGGLANSYGQSILQTPDSGIVLAGNTTIFVNAGANELYLIKTDANGNSGCNETNESISIFYPTAIVTNGGVSVASAFTITGTAAPITGNGGTDNVLCFSLGLNNYEVKNLEIEIYPNPFTDKITITTKTNVPTDIILYDITSRKLMQETFINTTTLNTTQLASGIYIYKVRNKNGVLKQGKVVKE